MAGGFFSRWKERRKRGLCSAVVVAAGSASRMEGIEKILAPLKGVPVLVHTLGVFERAEDISEVVVVTREDLLLEIGRLCKDFHLSKVTKVVVGGRERIHSVQAGLQEVSPQAELIAIHDGARPFLPQQVLEEVLLWGRKTGAAAPAIPVTDTIKRGEKGRVTETLDRSTLFALQTPQVFQADLIRPAIQKALEDQVSLTDDCAAVERLGMEVRLTQGSPTNLKLTTPLDLVVGQSILEAKERGIL